LRFGGVSDRHIGATPRSAYRSQHGEDDISNQRVSPLRARIPFRRGRAVDAGDPSDRSMKRRVSAMPLALCMSKNDRLN
jgi:hypothetical protein